MALSTSFANLLMDGIFTGATVTGLLENLSVGPLVNLYVSLHTASPGVGGSQLTNETVYSNYLRVAVTRNAGGWTVAGGVAQNTALVQFAQCGVTGATLSHVAVGTAGAGAGLVLFQGALNDALPVVTLVQPQFLATTLQLQLS